MTKRKRKKKRDIEISIRELELPMHERGRDLIHWAQETNLMPPERDIYNQEKEEN